MKNTGIVRRIDELGRVVIPKELRRTMHIKEGEEMEVFVAPDDSLVLKKYSALKGLKEFASEYAAILFRHTGNNCLICDADTFIACATDKNIYLNQRISAAMETFLSRRKSAYLRGKEVFSVANEGIVYKDMAICPIIAGGDVIGGIVILGKTYVGEVAKDLIEVAASFLSEQVI